MKNISQTIQATTTTKELAALETSLSRLYEEGVINKAQLISWDLRCCDRYDEILQGELDSVPTRTYFR